MSDQRTMFERLLAPITAHEFTHHHFGARPLVRKRAEPPEFTLLSLRDVERLLFSVQAPEKRHWFILVKDGISHPMAPPLVDDRGDLRPAEVTRRYHDGFTIVLNQLHKRSPVVASLCHEISDALSDGADVMVKGDVTANLYLTPPKAQGLAPHYDNHDVIVVQLGGAKGWRIYDRPYAPPIERLTERLDPAHLGAPLHDDVVSTGDLVYIPRGFPHEAATSDEYSMHLTIGIRTQTWRDVVATGGLVAGALRESLPSSADLRAELSERTAALADPEVAERSLARLRTEHVSGLFPAPSDHLEQINRLGEVDVGTRMRKRHGPHHVLEADGERVRLHFPGSVVELPAYVRPAVEFILGADTFEVGALPGLPSDSQRLILSRHLVGCGFVRSIGE